MYDAITVEDIKEEILSRISTNIDTREGSFTNDMISAIAYEIWNTYQSLDAIIPIAFVDETSGEYIDKRCAEYGIKRKPGTVASTTLTLSGTDGTLITKGKVFMTEEGLEYLTDDDVIIVEGTAIVDATASGIGEDYNVPEGAIIRQFSNLSGLSSVTSTEATGGTNPETDVALVKRLYDHLQKPATSGNAAHYRQWALEVPGCGDAKVFPLWDGPGTVKVVIIDSNKHPATETLVASVAEHIENVRPIGAIITVVSGVSKIIDLSAKITLAPGYSLQSVTEVYSKALIEHFKGITFTSSYISHAKVGNILLGIEGVIDYSNLLINNSSVNILLANEEAPILGTVDLEV